MRKSCFLGDPAHQRIHDLEELVLVDRVDPVHFQTAERIQRCVGEVVEVLRLGGEPDGLNAVAEGPQVSDVLRDRRS
jgi:hypothetical protein